MKRRLVALLSGALAVTTLAALIATWRWRVAAENGMDGAAQRSQTQLAEHLGRGTLAAQALDVITAERELSAAELLIPQIPAAHRLRPETLARHARCELAFSRQLYAEAMSCLDRAEPPARAWAASRSSESTLQLAEVLRLHGDAKAHAREWKAAAVDYNEAESLIEQLRLVAPDTAELTLAAAAVQQRLSRVEEIARNSNGVSDRLEKATALLARVVQKELSTRGLVQLIEVYQRLADLCTRWDRDPLAKSFNIKAYELAHALYVSNPENVRYQLALAAAERARGTDALREKRLLRATLFFAQASDLLELLVNRAPTNTQAWRDYFGLKTRLIATLVEQGHLPEGLEEFAKLDAAVRSFADAHAGNASDEALAVSIRGLSQLADAAQQVDRPQARIEASERSLRLAEQRVAQSPKLGDAQLDLLIAHANMILAAGVNEDSQAMASHAREARRLLPEEGSVEPDEQQIVTGIQNLIAQVLDADGAADSRHRADHG